MKNDCYTLKAKTKRNGRGNLKSVMCSVPVHDSLADSTVEPRVAPSDLKSYRPFIMEGLVSLVGQDDKVRIRISHATGTFGSLILSSIIPFSSNTLTGSVRPVVGMGLKVVNVSLHKIILNCGLFKSKQIKL